MLSSPPKTLLQWVGQTYKYLFSANGLYNYFQRAISAVRLVHADHPELHETTHVLDRQHEASMHQRKLSPHQLIEQFVLNKNLSAKDSCC